MMPFQNPSYYHPAPHQLPNHYQALQFQQTQSQQLAPQLSYQYQYNAPANNTIYFPNTSGIISTTTTASNALSQNPGAVVNSMTLVPASTNIIRNPSEESQSTNFQYPTSPVQGIKQKQQQIFPRINSPSSPISTTPLNGLPAKPNSPAEMTTPSSITSISNNHSNSYKPKIQLVHNNVTQYQIPVITTPLSNEVYNSNVNTPHHNLQIPSNAATPIYRYSAPEKNYYTNQQISQHQAQSQPQAQFYYQQPQQNHLYQHPIYQQPQYLPQHQYQQHPSHINSKNFLSPYIQKRKRRKYNEIKRYYKCNHKDCTKSYGTLNHLNFHVQLQGHGRKRLPSEFKDIRERIKQDRKHPESRNETDSENEN